MGGTMTYLPPPERGAENLTSELLAKELAEMVSLDLVLVGWRVNKHPMAKYMLAAMDSLGKTRENSPVVVLGTNPKRHSQHKKEAMRMGAAGFVGNLRDAFEEIMHVLEKPGEPEKYEKECAIL